MARNVNLGKQYPPMPRPEDFGVSNISFYIAKKRPSGYSAAKVEAYENTLREWKEAVREVGDDKSSK